MPWWSKSQDPKPDSSKEEPKNATFDPSKLPVAEKLPKGLQKIVDKADKDESYFYGINEGYPDSTESNLRYAAYAARLRTILLSAHRYVAYTSDIGESFRPVAHPNWVRAAYGVSWAYLIGDVSYEGLQAYRQNERIRETHATLTSNNELVAAAPGALAQAQPSVISPLDDYRTVMVQRAIFQGLASMGLPAFTIHSVVRYSGRAMKDMKNKTIRTWGPIGLGLAIVPFLPAMFDQPVENAVEWVFHKGFATFGGHDYVGNSPTMGREDLLRQKPKVAKEKEL
ncbi:hypothetical protein G7046_g7747 [Stylonectria norvegica]|nr:hypothetical protein G7046_g7747 [Stylonectria norvegica]